jgi:hypothetical protein
MIAQVGSPVLLSRRQILASPLLAAGLHWHGRQNAQAHLLVRKTIATVLCESGLRSPLTLGMARIILRPQSSTWAGTPGGVRMIVVEAGVLGVTTVSQAQQRFTAATFAATGPVPDAGDELLIPAGGAMAFPTSSIASVRNAGARSVVALDVAVYPEEPRALPRAFTTDDGVSFQLLASANALSLPTGPLTVTLEQVFLGARAEAPADVSVGLMLAYVEAGALVLSAQSGDVFAARGAASAPYSAPGSLQPLALRHERDLSAGGVIFLSQDGEAAIDNATDRQVELLMVMVRKAP